MRFILLYYLQTDDIFGHILDTFLVAMILCLLFESPIHALERIMMSSLRKTTTNKTKNTTNSDNQTPSTSEEQVA